MSGEMEAAQSADGAWLSDEECDILRDWWDEDTTVGVESSFPIISRILTARMAQAWDECAEEAHGLGWLHDYGSADMHSRNPYPRQERPMSEQKRTDNRAAVKELQAIRKELHELRRDLTRLNKPAPRRAEGDR